MIGFRWARVAAALALAWCGWGSRPASALDLQQALRQIAASNPTLAARRAMVAAARDRIGPAGAWESPMVELGAMNVPTNGRFDMEPMTMKTVSVSQRLPIFGGNGLMRRSAREAATGASAAAEMEHYRLYAMGWEAYADAYFAGRLSRLAEDQQQVMDRLVRSARARYQTGSGRLDDVLRAESEEARTRVDLASFNAEERAARARLDALRGIEQPPAATDTLAPPPEPTIPERPDPWLATVDATHPRLRELQAQADRYRWAARSARRMLWPDLTLSGSYGMRETLTGDRTQDNMFSVMVGFMVPVFATSRQLAEASEMDAMAAASAADRRAAELELEQQIRSIHAAASAARQTVALLADTVVVAQRRAVEASWSAYTAGSTDLWRVFEATHTLYSEEIALERARQSLAGELARLIAITGTGEPLGVPLPPPEVDPQ